MESRIVDGANSIVTGLHSQSFLPVGIQNLFSLTFLLAGILSNVYLGLYISEKYGKSLSGIRVLICNQVFANLLGLFSHAFLPTHNVRLQETEKRMDNLCKIMPSLGFLGVTVSISNLACICVVYYYNKKNSVVISRRSAWLVVVNLWLVAVLLTTPLTVSLTSLEITVDNTSAKMCAVIWQNENYQDLYINYVFIFKYMLPLLTISSMCFKLELMSAQCQWRKYFPRFPNFPVILIDILAATCLLLLVYFYPLHNASCAQKTSPFSKVFGSTTAFNIIRFLEMIGLANCSVVPVTLKLCVDEYCNDLSDVQKGKEEGFWIFKRKGKDDGECLLSLPSTNVGYITYDVLTTENVPVDSSISVTKHTDVKLLSTI